MQFPAQDVIRTFRLLEESGVPVWLDGGWGIDALLRRESRHHRDMDLVVPLDCLAAAESALAEAGFSKDDRDTDMPTRLVLRNSEGLEIDIHPVTIKADGSAVHIDTERGGSEKYTYVYSSAGLSGIGKIDGRVVRCTTAAEQIRQKIERRYSPWTEGRVRERGVSVDLEDISCLLQAFGAAEGTPGEPRMAHEARATDNPVVDAAGQFCLKHVADLNAQHSMLTARHTELTIQHAESLTQLAGLRTKNAELMAQIDAIRASTSWQLTAPMRWTARLLGMHWLKPRIQ
jgi:lincosamide nucleotidyltransferase A/C/D/E